MHKVKYFKIYLGGVGLPDPAHHVPSLLCRPVMGPASICLYVELSRIDGAIRLIIVCGAICIAAVSKHESRVVTACKVTCAQPADAQTKQSSAYA